MKEYEVIGKVFVYGLFYRLVKVVIKYKELRKFVVYNVMKFLLNEVSVFCLRNNFLLLRKCGKEDFVNFDL